MPHALALDRPLLIIQGGRDYQVPDTDFEIWTRRLGARPRVTLQRFEMLDHLMTTGSGPSTPQQYAEPGHVDGKLVAFIAAWIERSGQPPS